MVGQAAYPLGNLLGGVRRKTGTATNSRLWNWLAVPGLPTADTPPVARPIFIPPDEAFPHNAASTESRGHRTGPPLTPLAATSPGQSTARVVLESTLPAAPATA